MTDSRLMQARWRIGERYFMGASKSLGVQTVSFQPDDATINQDRMVVERWDLQGDRWLFLAVFDGHLGPVTVEHTANTLPARIRGRLYSFLRRSVRGQLDRTNVQRFEPMMTALLKKEIEDFDKSIGDALQQVCPRPAELDEQQARKLIAEHTDVVSRAFEGTTLALALINVDRRFMWAAGVGDSTVALSTVGNDGKRRAQRLCELHTLKNPQEYFRVIMAHSHHEQPLVDRENRIIGWLSVPRAIGDFALKLHASYLTNLFRYTPYGDREGIVEYAPKIITPPYMTAEPSVRFIDLGPVWGAQNKLLLFTDGVDSLVDGYMAFRPHQHSGADPVDVVSRLLADEVDPEIERILGHKLEPRWSREKNNVAVDILGNLVGGANVDRLEMVTNQQLLYDDGVAWPFHIDDTSIIVWGLSEA